MTLHRQRPHAFIAHCPHQTTKQEVAIPCRTRDWHLTNSSICWLDEWVFSYFQKTILILFVRRSTCPTTLYLLKTWCRIIGQLSKLLLNILDRIELHDLTVEWVYQFNQLSTIPALVHTVFSCPTYHSFIKDLVKALRGDSEPTFFQLSTCLLF